MMQWYLSRKNDSKDQGQHFATLKEFMAEIISSSLEMANFKGISVI